MTEPDALVPETIICVDCGSVCHLLSTPPPDAPFEPGDVVAYRCSGCNDRWDVVVPEEDDARGDAPPI